MKNVRITFEYYHVDPSDIVVYQLIMEYLVFYVNLGNNFRLKSGYCIDTHQPDIPYFVTYR